MVIAATICMLLGIIILLSNYQSSKQNFFFKRAPQIRICDLHSFDSTWITGFIEASNVLIPPVFGYESVFYNYALYKKNVRYERDSRGKKKKVEYWELYHSQSDSTLFLINDGSGKIAVNPAQAVKKYLMTDIYQTYRWKHTVTFLPASGSVSSVGVTSENKDQLIAKGETPLMLTPLRREQFMQAIKKGERFAMFGGLGLIWLSLSFASVAALSHLSVSVHSGMKMFIYGGLLGFIPFTGIYYYFIFNSFVSLRRKVINGWANIDVILKARRELIPNFVSSLEGYMSHERNTFTAISALHQAITNDSRLSTRIQSENEISKHISKIRISVENNPELKLGPADSLSAQLKLIEDKIAHSRSYYNALVEEYNSLCSEFPSNFIAGIHKFKSVPFYGDHLNDTMKLDTIGQTKMKGIDENSLKSLPTNIAAAVAAETQELAKKSA
ncbi:MAG: LemA family protein [Pseudomonadota bacterium]